MQTLSGGAEVWGLVRGPPLGGPLHLTCGGLGLDSQVGGTDVFRGVGWGTTVQWGLLLWSNELSLPPVDRQGLGGDGVQLLLASVCRARTWEDAEKPALVLTGRQRASLPCEGVIQEKVTISMTSEWVGTGAGARETWVRIQHTPEALGQFLNLPELYFATQPSPRGRWEDHRRWGGSRLVADSWEASFLSCLPYPAPQGPAPELRSTLQLRASGFGLHSVSLILSPPAQH